MITYTPAIKYFQFYSCEGHDIESHPLPEMKVQVLCCKFKHNFLEFLKFNMRADWYWSYLALDGSTNAKSLFFSEIAICQTLAVKIHRLV